MKKEFRNKWIYLIAASVLVISFAACSDDDDDVPAFSKDGKRLVKSLTLVDEDIDRESLGFATQVNFRYNGEGQMTEIDIRYVYEGDDGRTYTDRDIYTYSVSGNKLVVKHVYKDGENSEYDKNLDNVFTLNDEGLVISGNIANYEDAEKVHTYQCFYDEDRQLIKTISPGWNGTVDYIWENGNMMKSDGWWWYTYYDIENKANIDFSDITIDEPYIGDNGLYLNFTGYIGKMSKGLLKESRGSGKFEYELDSEGYVTKMTYKGYGTAVYTVQYY